MQNKLVRRELDALRGLGGAYLEGVVDAVPKEPFLMSALDFLDDDVPLVIAPYNFRDCEPLADCVEEVVLHILKTLDAVDLPLDKLGDFLVAFVVRVEGDDLEVEARDRVLPRLHLTEKMRVFLLELLV